MGLINRVRANAREDAAAVADGRAAKAKTDQERRDHEKYAKICRGQAKVLRGAK